MQSTDSGTAVPGESGTPAQFLVESQGPPAAGTGSGFLRAARHLAAARTPTDVFLIDDGVGFAVDATSEVAGVVDAGGRVWVDEVSLTERAALPASLRSWSSVATTPAHSEADSPVPLARDWFHAPFW